MNMNEPLASSVDDIHITEDHHSPVMDNVTAEMYLGSLALNPDQSVVGCVSDRPGTWHAAKAVPCSGTGDIEGLSLVPKPGDKEVRPNTVRRSARLLAQVSRNDYPGKYTQLNEPIHSAGLLLPLADRYFEDKPRLSPPPFVPVAPDKAQPIPEASVGIRAPRQRFSIT